jgi:hypothetical protein
MAKFPGKELPPVEKRLPRRPGIEELPAAERLRVRRRPGIEELPRANEFRIPHRPGIEELPAGPPYENFARAGVIRTLVREVLNLRQRVYKLESAALFAGFELVDLAAEYWPNELPAELEIGGGGGNIPHPGGEINEFPQVSIFQRIASLESRLVSLESNLLASIQALNEKVAGLKA